MTPDRFAGVVIVAAGRGERFGDSGKVLAEVAGRPLLYWSVAAALSASTVSEVVVVAGSHSHGAIADVLRQHVPEQPIAVCLGGERRQDSVMAGLGAVSGGCEIAIIHDAARPLATPAMFDAVAKAALESGAAITGVPVTDTIKEVNGATVVRTVDRTSLRAAQTPQAFRRTLLERAFERARERDRQFTDEAALMESLGHPVTVVEGASWNVKVTVPEDLDIADVLLAKQDRGARHVSS